MTWTQFMDMHSGGGTKEAPYEYIYIEAPEGEASAIFYAKFGHSPSRVSCTCCGDDYSVSHAETFEKLTGYERRCRYIEDARGWKYRGDDKLEGRYVEDGEEVPDGYAVSSTSSHRYGQYMTVEQYVAKPTVLVIPAADIKPEWRSVRIPTQGYVWVE